MILRRREGRRREGGREGPKEGGKEDGMHSKTRTHTLWSGGKNVRFAQDKPCFERQSIWWRRPDVANLGLNVDLSMER